VLAGGGKYIQAHTCEREREGEKEREQCN